MATCIDGDIPTPATALLGCTVKATLLAVAWVMLNALLVAAVSAPELAPKVYPVPTLLMDSPEKEATPFTALTVAVPERVPLPALLAMAKVIEAVELVTVLSKAS